MAGDYAHKCRTCQSESSIFYQINDYVDENCKISEMLDSVVPQINIKTTSQFSSVLCPECVEKLLISYRFQQLCIETNNCLYGFLRSVDCETNILHVSEDNPDLEIKEEFIEAECYESKKPSEHLDIQSDIDVLQNNLPRIDSDSRSNNELITPMESNDAEQSISLTKKCSIYPCEVCGKLFKRSNCLRRHGIVHSLDRPYACKICQYRFENARKFRNHMFLHEKRSALAKTLKAHESQNNSETIKSINFKTFPCTICPKIFITMPSLAKHFEDRHPQGEKHKCNYCDKKYIFHSRLMKHLNRHKHGKTIKLKERMRVHDSNLSSQSGNIEEEIEDAAFEPVKKLEELETSFQQDDNSPANNGIQNDFAFSIPEAQSLLYEIGQDVEGQCKELSGTTTFQCRHCPKSFVKQTSLAAHTKVHTKTELNKNVSVRKSDPLTQDVHNIFLTDLRSDAITEKARRDENSDSNNQPVIKTKVNRAKRIRKEKRHVCKFCGKKFGRPFNLRRHITLHSSTRPYQCGICKHRFADSSSLKTHLDTQTCLDKDEHVSESPDGCNLKSTILDPLKDETKMDIKEESEDELIKSEDYLELEREFLSDDSRL